MLILVTGATGFIGGHLVQALLRSGHEVRAIVRESSNYERLSSNGVEIKKGSLVDPESVSAACRNVDVVFNLAAKLGGQAVKVDEMRQVNVQAVRVLLEACQRNNVRQVIHCSTPGVVGMSGVAPECLPYRPSALYERTKCDGEKTALAYHKNNHVAVTVIRPDFVYGPGDLHKLKLFKAIKEDRFPLIGSGRSLLHPTYVDDVVSGCLITMENPAAFGEIFNIAGPRPVTVFELAKVISNTLGLRSTRKNVPVILAKLAAYGAEAAAGILNHEPPLTRYQVNFFTRDHASDTSKAEQTLGFEPQVSLSDGIQQTVEWYIDQGYL
ncbi:MAG: NAD(P)-dependent oxidoreductase [Armatimonadota bacterium]